MRDHGSFFDGQTARPHPITINVLSAGLQINGGRAESLGQWSYDGLRRAPGTDPGAALDLMHRDHPDARLVITDPGILGQLANAAPDVFKRREIRGGIPTRVLQIALIIGIIATFIFIIVPKASNVGAGVIPVSWETAWGKSFREQFTQRFKVCDKEEGVAALNAMMAKLLMTGPVHNTEYDISVTVVRFRQENAFATMGGQIVVFSRLIEVMEGPDELAGVLAHEIAHVIARHPLTHAIESLTTVSIAGNLGSGSSDVGGSLAIRAYSRAKETEADRIAAEILGEAGISTQGLANFFKRLQKSSKGGASGALALFNTHPALASRATQLRKGGDPQSKPALDGRQWRALRGICN